MIMRTNPRFCVFLNLTPVPFSNHAFKTTAVVFLFHRHFSREKTLQFRSFTKYLVRLRQTPARGLGALDPELTSVDCGGRKGLVALAADVDDLRAAPPRAAPSSPATRVLRSGRRRRARPGPNWRSGATVRSRRRRSGRCRAPECSSGHRQRRERDRRTGRASRR